MRVIWDDAKSLANLQKHGVSFEEATRLLASTANYLVIFDEGHSDIEDRFLAIGPVAGRILVISWTEPDEDTVRIISARRATSRERTLYVLHTGRPT